MKFTTVQVGTLALSGGLLFGALSTALIAAPAAVAAPDCSAQGVSNTVTGAIQNAQGYLGTHPGAGRVVRAAVHQPREVAAADIRAYFTANPGEYFELRGILAPIGQVQRDCNVTVLPPALASAYTEFMAG